jgi:hypothetical protein
LTFTHFGPELIVIGVIPIGCVTTTTDCSFMQTFSSWLRYGAGLFNNRPIITISKKKTISEFLK